MRFRTVSLSDANNVRLQKFDDNDRSLARQLSQAADTLQR
jgi:hypothetical protein